MTRMQAHPDLSPYRGTFVHPRLESELVMKNRSSSFHIARRLAASLFCLVATGAAAELSINPFFGSNGVLQREKPVPIWGVATSGETLTVVFREQRKTATADADGRWCVILDPMPAITDGSTLEISGSKSENTILLHNIVVGDVWFCSGQSNMAWTIQNADDADTELANADYPLIRHFRVADHPADAPQDRIEGFSWIVARPGTDHAGDNPTSARVFSAVAYFFARDVFHELGVPIGLIRSARGGTQIESWMSLETLQASAWWDDIQKAWQARLAQYPQRVTRYEAEHARWAQEAAAARANDEAPPREPRRPEHIPGSRWMPAGLFNGMVNPVTPMAIRGFLWYQGESNAGRHDAYADLFPTLIRQWRTDFGQGDLPFYFVQLANFNVNNDATGETWAFLREAQMAALDLPETGVAITIDVGDPGNVHPGNKQAVGNRLARLALTHTYGVDTPWSGPVPHDVHFEGGSVSIQFEHAEGLRLHLAASNGFTLAGEDRVFHPAAAVVDGTHVQLTAPAIETPVAVRYAWHNNPDAPLFNGAGLPAAPFRTDDWPAP